MARDKISELYQRNRSFPRTKPHDTCPAPQSARSYDASPRDGALRNNQPQDIENLPDHSPRKGVGGSLYYNDHPNDWVRGRGESGTGKPGFDFGGAWRKDMRSQIKGRRVDHNRHHTEFETTGKHGTTHEQQSWNPSKRSVPGYEKKLEYGSDASMPKHRFKDSEE